ncbi:MAG: damage-inducible protein DinB [Agarilytica sp.]
MTHKQNFELMACYNQRMNRSIYEAAAKLGAPALSEDRGAFFGSILGTLNHILVGDTIWLKRFSEHPEKLKALDYVRDLNYPHTLDTILYSEFDALNIARIRMDGVIQAFTCELTDKILSSSLSYRNTKGDPFTKNFGALIQHFFNHQTHHRGQVSTLLSQAGIDSGVTDLLIDIPNI